MVHTFQPICVHFVDKNADQDQLIFPYHVPYIVIGLVHEEPANFLKGKAKSCFRDWPFAYFSGGFISHLFRYYANTHTNKKDTVCLMTSVHPTFSPHNLFSNSHHDERTSFLISQLPKNRREFILKVLKVHINRIQLYLYSTNPRNRYKPKPKHE